MKKTKKPNIKHLFSPNADVVLFKGDARDLLKSVPNESIQLIVTSPPYNVGKEYEQVKNIKEYLEEQREIIELCVDRLKPTGSLCWQVGNYVSSNSEIIPLDVLLYQVFKDNNLLLRNRIVWHFEHGLHSQRRFSGRYETILWFTKDTSNYYFDLDSVRVPQKYPGKRSFRGPNAGKYSGHPDGKNPTDFWAHEFTSTIWDIPDAKANHVERFSALSPSPN